MKKGWWLLGIGLLAVLVAPAGCRRGNAELGTVPVSGTVRFKGEPVADATVNFVPKTPRLRGAVAKTDASGRFQLTTVAPGDGAMCGTYDVMISKAESLTPVDGKSGDKPKRPWRPTATEREPPITEKDVLPSKYKAASSSGLTADVKARGANDFTFDLKE